MSEKTRTSRHHLLIYHLTYQANTLPQWITLSDSTLTINPTSTSSVAIITVTVTDGKGGNDTASITVVPVPLVANGMTDRVDIKNQITFTITKQSLQISLQEAYHKKVNNVILYDCSGKKIASLKKSENVFTLQINGNKIGSGVYFCLVYGNDNKPLLTRTLTFLDK